MRFKDSVRLSALGPLSTFVETVLTSRPAASAVPGFGATERARWRPSSHLHVLLVEDCPVIQMLTRTQLGRWGIEPKIAATEQDVLRAITRHRFDIVLMGLDLPDIGHLDVAPNLREPMPAETGRRHVPVIAYGKNVRGSLPRRLKQQGFDAALRKPCTDDEMRACLYRWCERSFVPEGLSAAQVRLAQARHCRGHRGSP